MAPAARTMLIAATAAVLLLVLPAAAQARNAYVADFQSNSVGVIDLAANRLAIPPIEAPGGSEPYSLAIAPDGKTVWVVGYGSGGVASLDTASNLFLQAPIPVAVHSFGFAITPDGSRAYLANNDDDTVEVLDLQARTRVAGPIPVGEGPGAVAITPDGRRAYVSNGEGESVSVIDTATNQTIGPQIKVGKFPFTSAFTPDGRLLFVPVQGGVSVIDTATNALAGPLIRLGEPNNVAAAVAMSPDGTRAYAATREPGSVSVIDVATRQVIAGPVPTPGSVEFLALSPDGSRLVVEEYDPSVDTVVDTATLQPVGPSIPFGEEEGQVAVVPDQSPVASFTAQGRARPGVPFGFDGSASTDPDGAVAGWSWAFGDGAAARSTTPTISHAFRRPGRFPVTLTATDNEGCSVATVYTGQTAYCHGSPAAAVTKTVRVAYPGVRVRCPGTAASPCRVALTAVARKGRTLRAQSAIARARVRPGKRATVSLKPKKRFARKLARARRILVRLSVTVDGGTTTSVARLKVVQ